MILDTVENIGKYADIKMLKKVVAYIQTHDLSKLPDGRTDIDGDELYVMIQHPVLKKMEEAKPEAHNRYADLQLVISGTEIMGYAPREDLGAPIESNPDGDIWFYEGGNFSPLTIRSGMFAVFFPQDAHAPCIVSPEGGAVTKAVFKVAVK
ncbi:MAG: YhcH/YjgK/YiaL family protein [Bilifractor sp.]|jgi:biofilm protein TabA